MCVEDEDHFWEATEDTLVMVLRLFCDPPWYVLQCNQTIVAADLQRPRNYPLL